MPVCLHCVAKNVPPSTCYNLDVHGSITVIFHTNVSEKLGNYNILSFPPHLSSASALPGETGNPEIASFHLHAACFLPRAVLMGYLTISTNVRHYQTHHR